MDALKQNIITEWTVNSFEMHYPPPPSTPHFYVYVVRNYIRQEDAKICTCTFNCQHALWGHVQNVELGWK